MNALKRVSLAISGLLLLLFLLFHLSGLILAALAPLMFESYAASLHSAPWLIFPELALVISFLIHISLSFQKALSNSLAKNSSIIIISRRRDLLGDWAARSQSIGGILILSFLWIHLEQLRFPRSPYGEELSSLHHYLHTPITLIIYLLGVLALFFHLYHGLESSQRSLGSLTSKNASIIRILGRSLSFFIGISFGVLVFLFRGNLVINSLP